MPTTTAPAPFAGMGASCHRACSTSSPVESTSAAPASVQGSAPGFLRRSRTATLAGPGLMGHATIEMTMRYAHLTPEARESAVQQLDRPVPQLHAAPARDAGGVH
jgi:hypothetical protein